MNITIFNSFMLIHCFVFNQRLSPNKIGNLGIYSRVACTDFANTVKRAFACAAKRRKLLRWVCSVRVFAANETAVHCIADNPMSLWIDRVAESAHLFRLNSGSVHAKQWRGHDTRLFIRSSHRHGECDITASRKRSEGKVWPKHCYHQW